MIMNLINNNNYMGNFPIPALKSGLSCLIKPDFSAKLVHQTPFINLGESECLCFKVQLARMKFIIILKVDYIGPNKLTAMFLKYINNTFHMYRLYGDA